MLITVIDPSFEILSNTDGLLGLIERAGRTCYKSEDKITPDSAEKFVRMLIKNGHESVLEHASISVLITGDRSMSHQLVRHRIAAYSQSSQRFCDYSKLGFQVVCPPSIGVPSGKYYFDTKTNTLVNVYIDNVTFVLSAKHYQWIQNRYNDCLEYLQFRAEGILPEDARSCLPNATKTEIATTFNLRMWRHVFKERALNPKAQWQIKKIMQGILRKFAEKLPCVFEDQLEKLNAVCN